MRILDFWMGTTLPPKPPLASTSQLYAQLVFSDIPLYVNSHFHLVAPPPGTTVTGYDTTGASFKRWGIDSIYSYLVRTKPTLNKLNTGISFLSVIHDNSDVAAKRLKGRASENREQGSESRQSSPTNFPSNPDQFATNERF